MPTSKALWQAVATVALPSFIFWSIAAIVLRETLDSDARLQYLILFALPLPLPLIYPIHRRYRKGAQFGGVARSPRYHRTVGVLYLLIARAYSPFLVSPKGWGLISPSSHGTVLGRTRSKSIPSCAQGGNALTLSRRPPHASALMTRSYGLCAALAPI